MSEKYFNVICWYETVCTNAFPIYAENEEEAIEKAKEEFNEFNKHWMKAFNGSEKKLLKVEVQK